MTSLDDDFLNAFAKYRSSSLYSENAPFREDLNLDFRYEADRYISRLDKIRQNPLLDLARSISNEIRLPAGTRQIRAIPAHLLEEISISALGARAADMVRNNVHTVVLLNAPAQALDSASATLKRDLLRRRINEAGLSHLVTITMCQFPEKKGMGTIRGVLNDACIIAAAKFGVDDPILISSDIDILDISPSYFDEITRHFANRCLDVLSGPIYYGYSPEGQEFAPQGTRLAAPELVIGNRVFAARRALMLSGRLGGGRLFTTEGPNSVFRASAVCAAGGYDYSLALNEDGMMGNAIFAIRNSASSPYPSAVNAAYDYRLWIATDPRRTLRAVSFDRCIRESWRYVPFDQQDGHDIDLAKIVQRYSGQDDLLQVADVDFPIDKPLSGKMRDRIIKIFLTSLVDTRFGPGDLELYSSYFGIRSRGVQTDRIDGEVFATPDLHSALQRV